MSLLPSGYIVSTTGNMYVGAVERIGGTAIGLTSATTTTTGSPITLVKSTKDVATPHGRTTVKRKTVAGVYNATYALSSTGTFAYEPSGFIAMRLTTTINGTASTLLKFAGNKNRAHRALKQKAYGAKTSTAFRAGYWQPLATTGRSKWSTAPTANTGQYVTPTGTNTPSDDQGIYVTYLAIPGELTYMYGAQDATSVDYVRKN